MSISSEITRINNNIANAYDECETKGATMPQYENSANLASTIASIPSGGGGADLSDYFNSLVVSTTPSSTDNFSNTFLKKLPKFTIEAGITSLTYLFYNFPEEIIDFDGDIDCSNITSFQRLFYCSSTSYSKTKTINLTHFKNTQNVTDIRNIVSYNDKLQNLIGTKDFFSMTGVVKANSAFYNASKLTILDLSKFNPASGSTGTAMFQGTSKLAILDLSSLDFSNITTGNFFQYCGTSCLQSDGAYADGIPYIYVKDTTQQTNVLNLPPSQEARPDTWTTNNVVVKSN